MVEPIAKTKICPACDAVIGESETECPKCKVNFEELEDSIAAVDTASKVLAKRKAAAAPKPCPKCGKEHEGDCPPPAKKKSLIRALGASLRKKA